jgi:hypothetical protein
LNSSQISCACRLWRSPHEVIQRGFLLSWTKFLPAVFQVHHPDLDF